MVSMRGISYQWGFSETYRTGYFLAGGGLCFGNSPGMPLHGRPTGYQHHIWLEVNYRGDHFETSMTYLVSARGRIW